MSGHPFWDFSLAVYGRPGVAKACLALQDRHGLDVNLLLFCCWAGSKGRALDAADVQRLVAAAGSWNAEVVGPLRAVRRWLKTQESVARDLCEPLRAGIKAQELEAERLEQVILSDRVMVREAAGSAVLAARNLEAYLEASACAPDPADRTSLATLLTGCFTGLTGQEAEGLV